MSAINRAYLRNLARLYADGRPGGSNAFVVDSDATPDAVSFDTLINGALAELYDLLVAARGHEYYAQDLPLSIVSGTATYPLDSAFYQLLSVRLEWASGEFEELEPTGVRERTLYENSLAPWQRGSAKAYRLRGTQTASAQTIEFFPTPTVSVTGRYRFIPAFEPLDDDSDTFDGVNGWEKLVALKAAMEYREIAEKPLGNLPKLYAECMLRIQGLADQRNANFAEQVQQVFPEGVYRRPGGLGDGDGIFSGEFSGEFS